MITDDMFDQSYESRTVSWCLVWNVVRQTEAKRKGDELIRKTAFSYKVRAKAARLRTIRNWLPSDMTLPL